MAAVARASAEPVSTSKHVKGVSDVLTRLENKDLTPRERQWADEPCVARYLRANKMDAAKAATQLWHTIEFRRKDGIYDLHADMFQGFLDEGFLFVGGFAPTGEPALFVRKRTVKLAAGEADHYIHYLTWTFETAIRLAEQKGCEQWQIVLDMSQYSPKNSPPLSVTKRIINLVAHHYPERLHRLVIVDAPTVFWILWNTIYPFIDPVTRAKVFFGYSKKHDPKTGRLKSGAEDPSGLADLWHVYKAPYNKVEYLQLAAKAQALQPEP